VGGFLPGVIIFAMVAAAGTTATNAKPVCTSKCRDVEISFPFGLTDQTEACYLDKSFDITCVSGIPIRALVSVTLYWFLSLYLKKIS
jgi:xanthine/uracil permease